MDSVSTYSEARNEYLKQLSTWIVPYMIQHYRGVWSDALKVGGQQRVMVVFQEKCAEVPKWNQDIIDSNISKLLENCRCDYLEELMAAVFIAHTKVLIAIRVSSKHKKLQITLPKLDHFLHRVFSECARSFWKTPYLFLDDAKPIEMQKNLLQAEALCSESIATAVRSMLPIKNILNEYLSDDVMAAEPVIEEGPVAAPPIEEEKVPSPVTPAPVVAPIVEEPAAFASEPVASEPAPALAVESFVSETITDDSVKQVSVTDLTLSEPVESPRSILKAPTPVPEEETKEEIVIDTEKSVHFNDYDNVFQTGEPASFDYKPKTGEEEEPQLKIMEEEMPLSMDSMVTNLEPSGDQEKKEEEPLSLGPMVCDEVLD